jgi:hypothetical protein
MVNKMSMEMALRLGDLSHLKICKFYLGMALTIGTEYFTRDMEEIVAMNYEGVEQGRYKSARDAAQHLGLDESHISKVLSGRYHTHKGFMFIRAKDKLLIKR